VKGASFFAIAMLCLPESSRHNFFLLTQGADLLEHTAIVSRPCRTQVSRERKSAEVQLDRLRADAFAFDWIGSVLLCRLPSLCRH
jgi:hypothetical protein